MYLAGNYSDCNQKTTILASRSESILSYILQSSFQRLFFGRFRPRPGEGKLIKDQRATRDESSFQPIVCRRRLPDSSRLCAGFLYIFTNVSKSFTGVRRHCTDVREDLTDTRRFSTDVRVSSTDVRKKTTGIRKSSTDIRESSTEARRESTEARENSTGVREN